MNQKNCRHRLSFFATAVFLFFSISCKKEPAENSTPQPVSATVTADIKLTALSSAQTGIDFVNKVQDEGKINIFTWHFIYNGAGVAAGDINNDGLPDLYFTGSMTPDKLYLNKGGFKFEDITLAAGISTKIWSSGVTMADVNADGLLDIYVCKNSPTGNPDNNRNLLYINKGQNKFQEQAAFYGIDDIGFGTQASFFDADQDGDLDMFLVNQPFDEFARLVNRPEVVASYPVTDRFFFFENGKFVDKTRQLGMEDDRYGLNVSLGDYDMNGWTDLYICNDYHHGDRYYLNFGGVFKESVHTHTGHTSFYSMGSDVADVNKDGWLDLFTLDMAFEDHYRSKTNMGSMNRDRFWELVEEGHHYQYMQNGLQINAGHGYFAELAQVSGVSKSDWSFATLFADLDLDSDQDILITNGILRDLRNNDFQVFVREKYNNQVGPSNYLDVLKNIPVTPIRNIIFKNDGDAHFSKLPAASAFDTPNFSHGMAVADFDGDGKMDVAINNMNSPASIYQNATETSGHYIKIRLKGPGSNQNGLGCSVMIYTGDEKQINTMQTTRGYFSASEPVLHFGLGNHIKVDSVKVYWNHKEMSLLTNLKVDKDLLIDYSKERKIPFATDNLHPIEVADANVCDYVHKENVYDDYKDQVLLPYKLSQNGPHMAIGDVNGDDREDFFIGGAAGYSGSVYFQNPNGQFQLSRQAALAHDMQFEDQEAAFLDVDTDKDLDLIVTSGSNEFKEGNAALLTRCYFNDGKGTFSPAPKDVFPGVRINGQCLEVFDADGDKDMDLFLGGRVIGGKYPTPASSVILVNDNGKYADKTKAIAPDLANLGLVTDVVQDDVDKDGDIDLLIVGEWMMPTLLINEGTSGFIKKEVEAGGAGLWWTVEKGDFDSDGDMDFILGNLGWNNKFGGSQGTKLEVFANDFDRNGDFDVVLATTKQDKLLPVRGRECSSEEMPFILDKFENYESYAKAGLTEILTEDQLTNSTHKKLSTMSSLMLLNDGKGNFTSQELPAVCQRGPIKALYADDFNGDGKKDFMYAGNHLPTEVETARYDGLMPGICYSNGNSFTCETLYIKGQLRYDDARDIKMIRSGNGALVYLMSNNDGPLRSYVIQKNPQLVQ